tara:strand:- start:240 stop:1028 length:789 start_codon:yes stop_codon:yes gene_type:complete
MKLGLVFLSLVFGLSLTGGCASTTNKATTVQAKTHYDIAIATLNTGDGRGALRELLTAIELDPELPEAHNALGLVYHSLRHLKEGLEHYNKALALRPSFSEVHNNRGILLVDLGRYDEAILSFQSAIDDILYRTPSLAEGNMGWAYYKNGDVEKGIKHLRNAVVTNPKFCRGYEWLTRIALAEDNADEIIKNYGRFEKYCASDRTLLKSIRGDYLRQMKYYFALGLLKQGEQEQAREVLGECAISDSEGDFGSKCASALQAL